MHSLSRIVVGVDLEPGGTGPSAGSRRAARQAAWLAREAGARLALLHAVWHESHVDPLGGGWVVVGEGPPEGALEELEALRDEVAAGGVEAELELVDERPWLALARAADRGEADLLVVGRRTRSERAEDLERLGRTSRKVVRKAPAPVWVVREQGPEEVRTIVAATDLSAVGTEALRSGAWLAGRLGAALHVVHAHAVRWAPSATIVEGFSDRVGEEVERSMAEARGAIERELERAGRPERCDVQVRVAPPHLVIREAVDATGADLLVCGTVSRGGVAGLLVGNTAELLFERVGCSILAVKPADFVSPVRER